MSIRRLPPTIFQVVACALAVVVFARLKPGRWNGVAISIGNASYGIYLIHMTIMDTLFTLARAHALQPSLLVSFVVMASISLLTGWAFGLIEFSAYRAVTAKPMKIASERQAG